MASLLPKLIALLVASGLQSAAADEFPSRAIRIIVPYAAGGPSDVGTRLMADPLARHIGQSVFVENKPGAAGLVGTDAFLSAAPDGYTLLTGAIGPFVVIPAAKPVRYDVINDFVPLALVWNSSQVLVVHPKLAVKTLAEFIAHAKSNPGKITVGSAGIGSITHMSLELFKREADVDLVHVPFRSTGAALPNLLGGQIDAAFADVTLISEYVEAGSLSALSITAPERSQLLPNVPTTAESGLASVDTQNWFGLVASPKTPPATLARIMKAVDATLADPAYQASVTKQGLTLKRWDAASYRQLIRSQIERWTPIIKGAGIKLE